MGTLTLAAVVPTVNREILADFIVCLEACQRKPDALYIIDNSRAGIKNIDYTGACEIVRPNKQMTVNESWNLGRMLAAGHDLLSFLNDDILFSNFFIDDIIRAFRTLDSNCGIVCPATTNDISLWEQQQPRRRVIPGAYTSMRRREGWAYTIRRKALDACPLIPADILKTFCGDDWLWHHTQKAGWAWFHDATNLIYHAIGKTVRSERLRCTLEKERALLKELIA